MHTCNTHYTSIRSARIKFLNQVFGYCFRSPKRTGFFRILIAARRRGCVLLVISTDRPLFAFFDSRSETFKTNSNGENKRSSLIFWAKDLNLIPSYSLSSRNSPGQLAPRTNSSYTICIYSGSYREFPKRQPRIRFN